jgi:hypothetical protein
MKINNSKKSRKKVVVDHVQLFAKINYTIPLSLLILIWQIKFIRLKWGTIIFLINNKIKIDNLKKKLIYIFVHIIWSNCEVKLLLFIELYQLYNEHIFRYMVIIYLLC